MELRNIAVIGALAIFVASSELLAQSCPCPTGELAERVKSADAIFVGRALSATNDPGAAQRNGAGNWTHPDGEVQTRLTFDVQTVIKGKLPRFAEVISPTGQCGYPFSVGERYLIVGVLRGTTVMTDACKGNQSGSGAIATRTEAIDKILDADDR